MRLRSFQVLAVALFSLLPGLTLQARSVAAARGAEAHNEAREEREREERRERERAEARRHRTQSNGSAETVFKATETMKVAPVQVDFTRLAAFDAARPAVDEASLLGKIAGNEGEEDEGEEEPWNGPVAARTAPLPPSLLVASPAPSLNFQGLNDISDGINKYIPPDTSGAVGPTYIMTTLNNNYRILNKSTGAVVSTVAQSTFWTSLGISGPFDPNIVYDPVQGRWILVATSDGGSANSSVLLAVSSNTDPTSTWNLYKIDVDSTNTLWADYPMLGYTQNLITVGVNMFTNAANAFSKGKLFVIDYADARTGAGATFSTIDVTVTGNFCMHPAVTYSASETTQYLVSHVSSAGGTYILSKITGTAASPTLTVGSTLVNTLGGWTQPGGNTLPQSGTTTKIDIGDAYVRSKVVMRNGLIYYAQTVGLPAGASAATITHSAVQYTALNTNGTINNAVRLEDTTATAAAGEWYAYPAIDVNAAGDVLLGFSQFSGTHFGNAGYALHRATDTAGTLRDPYIYKSGLGIYYKTYSGTRNRWGDYSIGALDPSDAGVIWTLQEVADTPTGTGTTNGDGNWNTWWAKVAMPNSAPSAVADSYSVNEDATLSGSSVLANDTDADSDTLSAVLVSSPTHGTVTLNSDGTFTYTPTANYNGSDSFSYYATDQRLTSGTVLASITVNAVNDPPVASPQSVSTPEDTAQSITLSATDIDGNTLTYSVVTGVSHGTLTGAAPNLTYTPAANYNGTDSFTFKANDGTVDSNTATVSITISAVNDPPVAAAQSVSTNEDVAKAITLSATDADGNTLTYSVVAVPTHGVLSGTAPNLTYTPAANYNGGDSFTFKANDGTVDSNTATITITVSAVNDAPVAAAQSPSTAEDTAKGITLSATDVDGDTLSYSVVTGPTHGVLSGTAPNITYTPAADYNGGDSFTFKANDGTVDSNTATITITVTAVNDAPVASSQSATTNEDTGKPLTLGATDVDGDTLTYSIVSGPLHGVVTGTGSSRTYTPAADYNGSDSFTFKANDGAVDSNTATVSLTITAVNDAPVAATQSVSATEDTAKSITLTATDVDSGSLTYTVVVPPIHGSLSGTAPNLTYTPNANYNGGDNFSFKANDGALDSNTAQVTITVAAVNDPPTVTNGVATTNEDTAKLINFSGSDVDGDTLGYIIVDPPAHGSLSGSGSSRTYTPATNYNGSDTFTFKANDGTADSNTATISITITAVNDAPVADAQALSTNEDTAAPVTLTATDPDGDALFYTVVGSPAHGSLSGAAPNLTYTPSPNYHGSDSFTFKANDASVDSNTATVQLTVLSVNDAPVVDSQTVSVNGATSITLTGSDIDGDTLTWAVQNSPAHGTLTGTAPNLTYTPVANYVGSDNFTFVANDGAVDSAAGTITLNVSVANPLTATALTVDAQANSALSNGDGVLDPGETVIAKPRWQNGAAVPLDVNGVLQSWDGTSIINSSANYGTVAPAGQAECQSNVQCYALQMASSVSRPSVHWDTTMVERPSTTPTTSGADKNWLVHIGKTFNDVTSSSVFYRFIETLAHNNVTLGCGNATYCPSDSVLRNQMAAFIARSVAGGDANVLASGTAQGQSYNCVANGTSLFSDVLPTNTYCRHIHYIYNLSVTLGCASSPLRYCPSTPVTRGEMAAFISRAMLRPTGDPAVVSVFNNATLGRSYDCTDNAANHFSDVADNNVYCRHIHYIWATGVVDGFANGTYQPAGFVTREQMSKFLTNAFALKLYGP